MRAWFLAPPSCVCVYVCRYRQLAKSFRRAPRAVYRAVKLAGVLYLLAMTTCTIAGRKHYTVDVALAVVIAGLTFFRFQVYLLLLLLCLQSRMLSVF